MTPLISVIVPVYNVDKFLPQCIESIIGQTYENLEIILVDDGAKDNSGKICDEYATKDSRIKVIHKENAGVAEARNTGIRNIKGEYFCFVDGDDYVHKDYVEAMYSIICKYNADIAMCSYVFKYPNGKEWKTRNFEFPDNHIFSDTGYDALCKMLYSKIYSPSCCCKLFRANKFDIVFPKYLIGEDMLASIKYFQQANKVVMTNQRLYYYMQNENSIMHSVNPDKIYDIVTSGDAILNLIPTDNKQIQKAASFYITEKNLACLMNLYDSNQQRISHIFDNIKRHRMSVIMDKNVNLVIKLNCIISFFGLKVLYTIKNKRRQTN